jgi:hypothetical protein
LKREIPTEKASRDEINRWQAKDHPPASIGFSSVLVSPKEPRQPLSDHREEDRRAKDGTHELVSRPSAEKVLDVLSGLGSPDFLGEMFSALLSSAAALPRVIT